LLTEKGMLFEEIELGRSVTSRTLRAVSGGTTTPQVFLDGERIGTADLAAYFKH